MINIKISNRVLYTFIAIIIIIAIIGVGYAFSNPTTGVGHDADDIGPGTMTGPILIQGNTDISQNLAVLGTIYENGKALCKSDGTDCNSLNGLCIELIQQYQTDFCKYDSEPAYCSVRENYYGNCLCRDGYVKVPLGFESFGTGYSAYSEHYYTCFKE